MRLALLADGIHPFEMGGMQKHSFFLAKYLALQGVYVDVYHITQKHQSAEATWTTFIEDIPTQAHPFLRLRPIDWPQVKKFPGHYIRANRLFSKALYDKVRQESYDIVYAQGLTAMAFSSLPCPVIVNLHGLEMFQPAPNTKTWIQYYMLRRAAQLVLKRCDYCVSFGGHLTSLYNKLGIPKERQLIWPNGIDPNWKVTHPSPHHKPLRIVFVGRYERRKGVQELHEALEQLQANHREHFECHFIGPIPENKELHYYNIIYHGTVKDKSKLQSLLRSMDVLICPSYSEGLPTVLLEGMASGLAIITTDVGASAQLVNNNGWLLPNPRPKNIATAIKNTMELDERLLHQKKEQSLIHVEHYLWPNIVSDMLDRIRSFIPTNDNSTM